MTHFEQNRHGRIRSKVERAPNRGNHMHCSHSFKRCSDHSVSSRIESTPKDHSPIIDQLSVAMIFNFGQHLMARSPEMVAENRSRCKLVRTGRMGSQKRRTWVWNSRAYAIVIQLVHPISSCIQRQASQTNDHQLCNSTRLTVLHGTHTTSVGKHWLSFDNGRASF